MNGYREVFTSIPKNKNRKNLIKNSKNYCYKQDKICCKHEKTCIFKGKDV